ncbi:hypothetical protein C0991_005161 [Blastosporella zonata]|nr:hypothetical protein C0991_005161 [Blastosporella zonata]
MLRDVVWDAQHRVLARERDMSITQMHTSSLRQTHHSSQEAMEVDIDEPPQNPLRVMKRHLDSMDEYEDYSPTKRKRFESGIDVEML